MNILDICSDKKVKIEIENGLYLYPALVFRGNDGSFTIKLYMDKIAELYQKSWVKGKICFKDFKAGFILHEVGHIKYSDFTSLNSTTSSLKKEIRNILEDSMVEYKLSLDFPEVAKYFTFVLSAIKTEMETFSKKPEEIVAVNKVNKYIEMIFKFVRFNKIDKDADIAFLNFVLPLMLISKRSDSFTTNTCATMIYNWLYNQIESDIEVAEKALPTMLTKALDKEEIERMQRDEKTKIIKELEEKMIATKATNIKNKSTNSSQLFLDTINTYKTEIQNLHNTFKLIFTKMVQAPVYEGEINMKKQQNAYLSSLIGEENKDYLATQKKGIATDVIILRDVSGSTMKCARTYAEATIILIASLNNIKGINSTVINFASSSEIIKGLNESAYAIRIDDKANGGTEICSALDKLANMQFKGKKQIMFIISDGQIFDIVRAEEKISKLKQKLNLTIFKLGFNGYISNGYESCSLAELPKKVLTKLKECLYE